MRNHRTKDRREPFRSEVLGRVPGFSVTFQNNRFGWIGIVPDKSLTVTWVPENWTQLPAMQLALCKRARCQQKISFLPTLPPQILLNNLLYDLAQVTIPTDNVDETYLQKPEHWDTGLIHNFMLFNLPHIKGKEFLRDACKPQKRWSGRRDLNSGPPAPKAGALPGCATPRHEVR